MGILTEIFNIAGSGALGGVFGFATSMIKRVVASKEAEAQFERNIRLRELDREDSAAERLHELKLHELNQAAQERETEREIKVIDMQGRQEAFKASQDDQKALSSNPNGSQWTIDVLRMVRPVLTLLYFILAAIIFFKVNDEELVKYIVYQVVFLAALTCMSWFGDRPIRGEFGLPKIGAK